MERTGSTRPIQGGGNGIGFRAPRQMARMNCNQLMKISREAILRAGIKLEEEARVMNQIGEVDEMRKNKMKTWLDELSNRFFVLNSRMQDTRTTNQAQEITCPEQSSSQGSIPNIPAIVSVLSQDVSRKWVPGIPKTVEITVKLWRFGDPTANQIPIRKLSTAAKRKAVIGIQHYSDKIWDSTGNKRRLFRIQALTQLVISGSETISVDEEGSDSAWNDALAIFHQKWDIKGNPRALSTILKHK